MTNTRPLYIMISRTDTGMARFIRAFSGFQYNHVSMTLDPSLRIWCSFARYHQDAPFYSGFIKEPVERFLANTGDANVRIFRLDLPREKARRVEQLFLQAGRKETRLIYNYFDAMASIMDLKIAISNSYTCLSFASELLSTDCLSIRELCETLSPCLMYEGSLGDLLQDSGDREELYFTRLGLLRGTAKSARQLSTLTVRTVYHGFNRYMLSAFRRTVR